MTLTKAIWLQMRVVVVNKCTVEEVLKMPWSQGKYYIARNQMPSSPCGGGTWTYQPQPQKMLQKPWPCIELPTFRLSWRSQGITIDLQLWSSVPLKQMAALENGHFMLLRSPFKPAKLYVPQQDEMQGTTVG